MNHSQCIRGYHRSSKAWYAKAEEPVEVMFGMYTEDGGTTGEMSMVWVKSANKQWAILKCSEYNWSALSLFTDLIQKMGEVDSDSEEIQEEGFCKMLDECGFKDLTAYTNS